MHTWECTKMPVPPCVDNPLNTSQCGSKGDQICDTPADYNPLQSNPDQLPFPKSSYNPDRTNIMSYHYTYPLDHFSIGQGIRMKNSIASAANLQSVRSYACAKIEGPRGLCLNQTDNYYLSGVSFGNPNFSWSVSYNLQINGSSTNSSVNITRTNYGLAWIRVLINGATMKVKRVRCDYSGGSRIVGLYDWVSKDYGNMGLVVPIDQENIDEEDPTVSYLWEIKENINPENTRQDEIKAYFIGSSTFDTKLETNTNQVVVNWGNCTNSYLISCHEVTQSGETYIISENYVDVGNPKNNPCFKNSFQTIIAPNPVRNGQINVVVNKPDNSNPCNYKNLEEPQFFNSELDKINNSVTIFDYYGNQIYSNIFESNEFTIENVQLISGNNYVINLFTKEGGFSQRVIIAE